MEAESLELGAWASGVRAITSFLHVYVDYALPRKPMILIILAALIILSDARHRVILQVKDAFNATDIGPTLDRDPGWERSIASHLLDAADVVPFNANFTAWMTSTWDIDVTAGVYDPETGGYNFTNGQAYPTTIIDPQHIIIYDSVHPNRAGKWSVSVSAWFVGFNTTFVTSSGAYVDPLSGLMYMKFFFLKVGADWSKPQNKEVMPCQTDVTAKWFTNQYILGGEWGGLDDVIRYTCFDMTSKPVSYCNKYEINVYDRVGDYVNETARVTYICE